MFIALLTLLSALSISGVAAYYSIIGLATIFPGAFIPVVLMGSVLEVGKLVCASWLYRNWTSTNLLLRSYLFFAVIVLSLVTSMGIFGFLSKAHLQNEFADGSVIQKIEIINSQIRTEESIIARQNEVIKRSFGTGTSNTVRLEQLNQRLVQLDREVEAYTKQGSSFFGGDSVKKGLDLKASQKAERDKINTEINRLTSTSSTSSSAAEQQIARSQQKITEFIQKRDPLMSERLKLEAEIGPIKYIAALAVDVGMSQKVDANSAVRWVIIILIFVFDPLAVLMLVAANQSLVRRFPIPVDPPAEILDLERPDLDTPVIPTGVVKQDPKVDQWNEVMLKAKAELAVEEAQIQAKQRLNEWQEKLEKFNTKVEEPTPMKIEIVPANEEKKPENMVSYTLTDLVTTKVKEDEILEQFSEITYDPESKKKTDLALQNSKSVVVSLGQVIVDKKGVPQKKMLTDREIRDTLNKFHQEHGQYTDVSDVELKQERDNINKKRFLDAVDITEADARNHAPITKSRMQFFEDYIDDILRGDVEAIDLPPEIARTCAILLSKFDNPTVVEPRPAGQPDVAVLTTAQLKETWQPQSAIEDRDMTDDELADLIDGFEQDNAESSAVDIVLKDGKKSLVPKKSYVQNEEQFESNQWSKILDIPEPEKNEILLPNLVGVDDKDISVEVKQTVLLPKDKLMNHKSKLLSDSEYRQKIEQRINDLLIKLEQGDIQLEDLPNQDQQTILNILNNN